MTFFKEELMFVDVLCELRARPCQAHHVSVFVNIGSNVSARFWAPSRLRAEPTPYHTEDPLQAVDSTELRLVARILNVCTVCANYFSARVFLL